jgi:hypothetical protein
MLIPMSSLSVALQALLGAAILVMHRLDPFLAMSNISMSATPARKLGSLLRDEQVAHSLAAVVYACVVLPCTVPHTHRTHSSVSMKSIIEFVYVCVCTRRARGSAWCSV